MRETSHVTVYIQVIFILRSEIVSLPHCLYVSVFVKNNYSIHWCVFALFLFIFSFILYLLSIESIQSLMVINSQIKIYWKKLSNVLKILQIYQELVSIEKNPKRKKSKIVQLCYKKKMWKKIFFCSLPGEIFFNTWSDGNNFFSLALLPNKSIQIFRVHIKHYWHFDGVTPKQYYTIFQTPGNTDIFRELLMNNATHFSRI